MVLVRFIVMLYRGLVGNRNRKVATGWVLSSSHFVCTLWRSSVAVLDPGWGIAAVAVFAETICVNSAGTAEPRRFPDPWNEEDVVAT